MTLRTGTQKQVRDRYPETMRKNGNATKTNTYEHPVLPPYTQCPPHPIDQSSAQNLKKNETTKTKPPVEPMTVAVLHFHP